MMPICHWKGCNQLACNYMGKIWNGTELFKGKPWFNPTYLCDKHTKKLLKQLNCKMKDKDAEQRKK